jgi:hypothetical protein
MMADVDLNQFYDAVAEELASTLTRSSFEKKGMAQYSFWCPRTWTKHPNGRHPKLSVNFRKDLFHCWVCHYKGIASELLKHKGLLNSEDWKIYDENKIIRCADETKEFVVKSFPVPKHTPITQDNFRSFGEIRSAYNYITERLKCSIDFIEDFELSISTEVFFPSKNDPAKHWKREISCIFIPSFDRDMHMNYYFQREFLFNQSKKYNPIAKKSKIIAFESRIDWNKKNLVLVEGGFDSLWLWSMGIQNVPLLGQDLSKNFLLFHNIRVYGIEPVILLDQDAFDSAIAIKDEFSRNGIQSGVYHVLYDRVQKNYPCEMHGNLDPALLKKQHILQLKDEFDV